MGLKKYYKSFTPAFYLKPENSGLVCPKTNGGPCIYNQCSIILSILSNSTMIKVILKASKPLFIKAIDYFTIPLKVYLNA